MIDRDCKSIPIAGLNEFCHQIKIGSNSRTELIRDQIKIFRPFPRQFNTKSFVDVYPWNALIVQQITAHFNNSTATQLARTGIALSLINLFAEVPCMPFLSDLSISIDHIENLFPFRAQIYFSYATRHIILY